MTMVTGQTSEYDTGDVANMRVKDLIIDCRK